MKPSTFALSALPCLALLLAAAPLQAAPEPAIVRLTSLGGGQYMNHGGGDQDSVTATSAFPLNHDGSGHEFVTAGPDIWRLVDWNGGELKSGDSISLAATTATEPFYLHSDSCGAGATPTTKKHATMSAGLTSQEIFTIVRVNSSLDCPQPGMCLPKYGVAEPGTVIDNGSAVAIQAPLACYLSRGDDGTVRADRTTVTGVVPSPVWRLWYKMIPQHTGNLAGHIDGCFGGMGAGCWLNITLWPFSGSIAWETVPSGIGFNTFKTIDVSVGSIAHDNCCLRNPLGKICGGVFSGSATEKTKGGVIPPRGVMSLLEVPVQVWQGTHCEWEWERAFDAFYLFTTWTKKFGPYYTDVTRACPNCVTSGELAWGLSTDHLTTYSSTRRAWMFHDLVWKKWTSDVASSYPNANETNATAALRAPVGTHIYPHGLYPDNRILGDFCSTGTAQWDPVNSWTCSAITCDSGLAHWDLFSWSWQCDPL